jgi:RNA polymerase sigma-32 factor
LSGQDKKQINKTKSLEADSTVAVEVLDPEEASLISDAIPVEVLESEILETEDVSEALSGEKSLASYDALSAYLKELRAIPRLTSEEEHALAIKYFDNKDLKAAYRLVQSNLWLVMKIAREYAHAAKNLLDLAQEGNIGLMEAVKNFNPYKGAKLPSYAVWWIRAYIIRYLIANWRMVKLGTTQAQRKLFFNLHKEKERLERQGFVAGPKLLAEKLNVKESEVIEMQQRLGSGDLSVDAPLSSDSDQTMHAVLSSEEANIEDNIALEELRALIQSAIVNYQDTLKKNEQLIFKKRLLSDEKATLQELADELKISKERVRQIEVKLIEGFKQFIHNNFDEEVLQQFEFLVN